MALEDNTKKDLAAMIRALQEKLKEMKPVEAQQEAKIEELKSNAIGLIKDENDFYSLVYIKFDAEKNAAAIEKLEQVDTRDIAIVDFKLKKYVAEEIMRKTRGGKYV